MGDPLNNKSLFYACADTLNLVLYVGAKKTTGAKDHPIRIGNLIYDWPVEVVQATHSRDVVGLLTQGPGNVFMIVIAIRSGTDTTTHFFIVDKAQISPVTAFPTDPLHITPENIKTLYGQSVVLHRTRAVIAGTNEEWLEA